ncbi:P4 alpha zinc-binding domain-containing protein [uncultured Hoeflea sp.]|uniref:DUF7146 domain-containing protein n=1 Tax=uncultured Hoeflea sp. TaxID=538666 RepID=UPI0030DAB92A
MSEILDLFVARARDVSIAEAAPRLGLALKGSGAEQAMPCPQCGGKDRFALNTTKNKWNCRGGSVGGNDAIGMAAHILGLDVAQRPEFLESCGAVLGEAVPDAGEQVSEERRAEICAEAEARAVKAARDAADRDREANSFREKELAKCRGIYEAGVEGVVHAARYIYARSGLPIEHVLVHCRSLRFEPKLTYWHGKDERGYARDVWCGPALVLPFVDDSGELIGIHQTWIDVDRAPKFRPTLYGLSKAGADADREDRAGPPTALWPSSADLDAGLYEPLATKKMRGSKKGGVIPVAGELSATRWVVGEGIENVAAWLAAELAEDTDLARSTFYAAAGDIGNLAGAAARTGRFAHPYEVKTDAKGVARPVMMPSPDPAPDRLGEGFPLGPHVRELLFLGDGDSEPVWTAAHMARAEARAELVAPGVDVTTAWPPRGHDWAEVIAMALRGEAA